MYMCMYVYVCVYIYSIDPNIRMFFSWKYMWKNAVVLYSKSRLWHVNNTPTTIGGAKYAYNESAMKYVM